MITNLITEFADRFFLSQTCAVLRSFVHCDRQYEFALHIPRDQGKILRGLADCLLDVWYCWDCNHFHRVDLDDFPGSHKPTSFFNSKYCAKKSPRPFAYRPYPSSSFRYPILNHHVQLAKKYTRRTRGTGPYQTYLSNLLLPWQPTDGLLPGEHIACYPRIVDEHLILKNRFILLEENAPFSSLKAESLFLVSLCAHITHDYALICEGYGLGHNYLWQLFLRKVSQAVEAPGTTVFGDCQFCFTQYEAVTEKSGNLKISAWPIPIDCWKVDHRDKEHPSFPEGHPPGLLSEF